MLKTRKINRIIEADTSHYGNYQGIYGQGDSNFIYGADALAQILTHQILSIRGEITNKTDFGVDWFSRNAGDNQKVVLDTQIREILLKNPYVRSILTFVSNYNANSNSYTLNFTIDTTEGLLQINI